MRTLLRSKIFQQLLGISITLLIAGWLIVSLEWSKVFDALKEASVYPLALSLLLMVAHLWLRSYRWRFLLPQVATPPNLRTLFDSFMAGNFATYILPLRAGEFIRPYLLSKKTVYPFPTAFTSIVIERFFDLICVLLSFAVLLQFLPELDPVLYKGAQLLGILAVVILIVILLGIFGPGQLRRLSAILVRFLPARLAPLALKFVEDLLHGLSVLRHGGNLLRVTFLSLLVWGSCYLLFWSFLLCFSIPPTFLIGTTVAVVLALAVAVPSAPGFLGVYQGGCIIAFKAFGISEEIAVAYGILTHLFHYIVTVGYGLWLLQRYNMRLSDLQKKSP
ncbi:MAG: UPF0104 family protein [Proteobacteria bacterium]|nr:UPF0104 family protein [Pseudomonadota bacterium]